MAREVKRRSQSEPRPIIAEEPNTIERISPALEIERSSAREEGRTEGRAFANIAVGTSSSGVGMASTTVLAKRSTGFARGAGGGPAASDDSTVPLRATGRSVT